MHEEKFFTLHSDAVNLGFVPGVVDVPKYAQQQQTLTHLLNREVATVGLI